ncbi:MAG: hypothetical protein HKN82_12970 [Akkermansiaceae bacterium]|nr:hypothetical protein [Akkermansiaceae bacterium]
MRILWTRLLLILLVAGAGFALWSNRTALHRMGRDIFAAKDGPGTPAPDPETYSVLSDDLESHRQRLSDAYAAAGSDAERTAILRSARNLLEGALPRLMRCWLGTPWAYEGIAHEPGGGKVACGYFVSSVLQDARFDVEWGRLAQQPSQNILGTFLREDELHIRVGTDYELFLTELQSRGPGIYIVGLDSHVAFLVIPDSGEIRFIHSSGSRPWCVVDEDRESADVLRRSRYRVTGNLTANPNVIARWLMGEKFPTRT